MDVFGENIYSNTFGSCIFYEQSIKYQFHSIELQIFFFKSIIHCIMNDEDIFIKKYGVFTKKTQMLYCDFCSSIITLISLLVPPIYYAHESYQNRVWTIGYFRLSGQEMQSLVIPYIYNSNSAHKLSWSKRLFRWFWSHNVQR